MPPPRRPPKNQIFERLNLGCQSVMKSDRDGADSKKCIRMLRRVRKLCPHAAPHRIQTQLSSRCTAPRHKLCILQISTNIRKKLPVGSSLAYNIGIDFFCIILDGFQRGGPLHLCQTICFFKHLLIKETNALAQANQKLIFGGSIWGPLGEWYPQSMSKHLSLKHLLI